MGLTLAVAFDLLQADSGSATSKPLRLMREGGERHSPLSSAVASWYDPVILWGVKTAISLPDDTFQRVDDAAKRLGVSRSEFFARAAERWLDSLDDDGTTDEINRAIAGLEPDHAFTDAAAAAMAARDPDQ